MPKCFIVNRTRTDNVSGTMKRADTPLKTEVENAVRNFSGNRLAKALAVFCMTAFLITMISTNFGVCYAVSINGESVGTVAYKSEIASVIGEIEQKASEFLGYSVQIQNYAFTTKIEPISQITDDTTAIAEAYLQKLDSASDASVMPMYVIAVDGKTVGAVKDQAEAQEILNSIIGEYSDGTEVRAAIQQDVSVSYGYVDTSSTLCDAAQIKSLLDPVSMASSYSVDVKTVQKIEYDEEVPFQTVTTTDDTMYCDEQSVDTEGVDGVNHVVAYQQYINGVASGDPIVLSTTTVTAPVNEVIRVGSMTRESTSSSSVSVSASEVSSTGSYIWPTNGVITSYFGYRSGSIGSSYHEGLDIAGSYGQEIYAADGGTVYFADWSGNYGIVVKIQHANGDITYYAHCSSVCVSAGDEVTQGQVIAYMGSTGNASGDHLHFSLIVNGEQVDPLPYLP